MDKISGIYCIKNLCNEKKYIGYSCNIYSRFRQHKSHLNRNIHKNIHLQSSWNFYGKNNFEFMIIEECCIKDLQNRETYFINFFNTTDRNFGYNLTQGGDGCNGISEETRERMSIAQKIRKTHYRHPDTGKNISKALTGKKLSEEHRIKCGLHTFGNKYMLGKKHSEESKEKMADKNRGIKRKKNSTSKYVGVCYDKSNNFWKMSFFTDNNERITKNFKTEVEAAMAYNELSSEFYGWKAKLNKINDEDLIRIWESE